MDDFDISKIPSGDSNEPIPLSENTGNAGVSHSPLNLGGNAAKPLKIEMPSDPSETVAKKPAHNMDSTERITGVRTFFTKLHAGAIDFLSEQITKWLNDNPDIVIKRTNVVTGEIQGKKTEPNVIITVWY